MKTAFQRVALLCALLVPAVLAPRASAQSNSVIYQDALASGWNDWSWDSTINKTNTSPVRSGTYSISARLDAYGALSLYHDSMTWTQYHAVEFHVRAGTNTNLGVFVYAQTAGKEFTYLPLTNYVDGRTLSTSAWKKAWIPIDDFGITSSGVNRINWKNESGINLSPFYLDDITLVNTNTPAGDTNVVSEFSITSRLDAVSGQILVDFGGQTSAYYHVWASTSLVQGAWTPVGMMLGADWLRTWTNAWTTDAAFVRFSGLLHRDSWDTDGDGLLDVYELQNPPLDPLSAYSDADGLPDGWEDQYGLDPTDADGEHGDDGDPDGDGRGNLAELDAGLNPQYIERDEVPLYLDYGAGPWYHDGNGGGWIDPSSTSYVFSNRYAMRVGLPSNDALAILRVVGSNYLDTTGFTNLEFRINGGPTNGQNPYVAVRLEENTWPGGVPLTDYVTVLSNTWSLARIPLTHLGAAGVSNLAWVFFKNTNATAIPQFWVDDVKLVKPWPPAPPVVAVSVTSPASPVLSRRLFGVNTCAWDDLLTNSGTAARLAEGGITMLRFPGGSLADWYDWQNNRSKTNPAHVFPANTSNFLVLADALGAEKNITVNYGRGSAAEASNWVSHVFNTLGRTVEWWCVGNEIYGEWEHDTNTPPHDAVKYAARWREYRTAMTNARPGIKVGVGGTYSQDDYTNAHPAVTNPADGTIHRGWSAVLLHELSNSPPDFYEIHYYDSGTLVPFDRASDYHLLDRIGNKRMAVQAVRDMLSDYLGPAGSNVVIHVAEDNSIGGWPGKQTTSLIGGLYLADAFAQSCLAGADAFLWWDLHNGPETNAENNLSTTLYGWRSYASYGLLASGSCTDFGDVINEPYPPFYALKLLTNFARPGDHFVAVTNRFPDVLHAYACIPPDTASVRLLVINVSPDSALRPAISLEGFAPGTSAAVYTYGMAEDAGRADITVTNLAVSSPTNIRYTFPPYSMTVLGF